MKLRTGLAAGGLAALLALGAVACEVEGDPIDDPLEDDTMEEEGVD